MRTMIVAALALSLAGGSAPVWGQDAPAASAALAAAKGKMLMSSDGARLATVYRVADGGVQIILDGRMVAVPASTVTIAGGKVTTSLTKGQVIALP